MCVEKQLFCTECAQRLASVERHHKTVDYRVGELDADLGEIGSRKKERFGIQITSSTKKEGDLIATTKFWMHLNANYAEVHHRVPTG